MPTLLTTRRMSPALAARVKASVRGSRSAPGARLAPRAVSILRLGLIAVCIGAASSLLVAWQRTTRELEAERAQLLERIRRESASLGAHAKAAGARAVGLLQRSSGPYAGDVVADELRASDALDSVLAESLIFVRGPLASFRSELRTREAAAGSRKDALVLCLMDPPEARSEKALLGRARAAHGGERLRERTAHVARLHDLFHGLRVLGPEIEQQVMAATQKREIEKRARAFDAAPLAETKRAARSGRLLFVMDEPADGTGPTELDGERAHDVRVGLVDLASEKMLFQVRRRVDPSWLSEGARAEYASGIDSCALALDVRAAVAGAAVVNGG